MNYMKVYIFVLNYFCVFMSTSSFFASSFSIRMHSRVDGKVPNRRVWPPPQPPPVWRNYLYISSSFDVVDDDGDDDTESKKITILFFFLSWWSALRVAKKNCRKSATAMRFDRNYKFTVFRCVFSLLLSFSLFPCILWMWIGDCVGVQLPVQQCWRQRHRHHRLVDSSVKFNFSLHSVPYACRV